MNTEVINLTEEKMNKTLDNLEHRFVTVRAGRANPSSLDGITADYYGSPTPLKQLATISVPEARQLLIKPFDRSCLGAIEKAIFESNLGYTPNNDGETIRIIIPVLTEERRKELTKQVRAMAEDAKVSIRNIRHDANEDIEKEEISEDEQKNLQNRVQDLVNKYNKLIDEKTKEKENELMIQKFIEKHPDMEVIKQRTILNYEYHTDGFYMCKMKKG